jgi:hypothetical protein
MKNRIDHKLDEISMVGTMIRFLAVSSALVFILVTIGLAYSLVNPF